MQNAVLVARSLRNGHDDEVGGKKLSLMGHVRCFGFQICGILLQSSQHGIGLKAPVHPKIVVYHESVETSENRHGGVSRNWIFGVYLVRDIGKAHRIRHKLGVKCEWTLGRGSVGLATRQLAVPSATFKNKTGVSLKRGCQFQRINSRDTIGIVQLKGGALQIPRIGAGCDRSRVRIQEIILIDDNVGRAAGRPANDGEIAIIGNVNRVKNHTVKKLSHVQPLNLQIIAMVAPT